MFSLAIDFRQGIRQSICALLITVVAPLHWGHSAFAQEATKPSPASRLEEPLNRGLDANLFMQTSAEYRAVCLQTFALAKLRLDEAVAGAPQDGRRPVVVLDLDETVLDNAGFQSWLLRTGLAYDQTFFDRWEMFGGQQVELIPGAKQFILDAEKMGVGVVYISNRHDRFRQATKATLQRLGIAVRDDRDLKLSTTTSDKTSRRQEIESRDNGRILLLIGDNLRDFDEAFRFPPIAEDATPTGVAAMIEARKQVVDDHAARWGNRWIVLPNPAYGEWAKPLGRGKGDMAQLKHRGTEIGMAFWNVENLFDLEDDPLVEGDEEFTPSGQYAWTAERLEIKLNNLARVINRMHDGQGPAVLGLAEIENRYVVELLVEKLAPLGRDYKIVHQDSPSNRGIDCALIYDAKVFELKTAQFHFVDAGDTRDILEAELEREGAKITVFVNHWPSRGHAPDARMTAAKTLRKRTDVILAEDPLADMIIMGDFNDYPVDPSLTEGLQAVGELAQLKHGFLFNTSYTAVPDQTNGTYVFQNQWGILDQIIVSPGMLVPGGVSWGLGSTRPVVLADDQLYVPANGIPRPSRSYTRTTFHANGYSDHMPVVTTIFW
jgi:5'-nucleotidase (lipoprotein e(P4) family)